MSKKVLITAPWFTKSCLDDLKKNFEVTQNTKKTWFSKEELVKIIDQYDAVIAGLDSFSSDVLKKATKLKIIARRGIGFDNVDLDYCKANGIIVTNTPVPEEHLAVAEFTVGLIIDVLRNITFSHIALQNGSWEREAFLGRDLLTTHVGILGLGHIGGRTAEILRSMGVKVSYCDPYVDDSRYRKVDVETLFKECDLISVHLPLTSETRGMINARLLSLMKKGSYIVNTSRGEILNERDIVNYLENGTLKGVATDVFSTEPPEKNPLLNRKDVITTSHIAAFSENSFRKIDSICIQNVSKVLLENSEPSFRIV
ncbi:MAG: NAD(P)-dependent oxidoreductase [Nitrososphaeria archaeon]